MAAGLAAASVVETVDCAVEAEELPAETEEVAELAASLITGVGSTAVEGVFPVVCVVAVPLVADALDAGCGPAVFAGVADAPAAGGVAGVAVALDEAVPSVVGVVLADVAVGGAVSLVVEVEG